MFESFILKAIPEGKTQIEMLDPSLDHPFEGSNGPFLEPYVSRDKLSNTTEDTFEQSRNGTGEAPGWSPTSEVGLNMPPPSEIHGFGGLRGSIPSFLKMFSKLLRGGVRGAPTLGLEWFWCRRGRPNTKNPRFPAGPKTMY